MQSIRLLSNNHRLLQSMHADLITEIKYELVEFEDLDKKLLDNFDFARALLEVKPEWFEFLSDRLQAEPELAIRARALGGLSQWSFQQLSLDLTSPQLQTLLVPYLADAKLDLDDLPNSYADDEDFILAIIESLREKARKGESYWVRADVLLRQSTERLRASQPFVDSCIRGFRRLHILRDALFDFSSFEPWLKDLFLSGTISGHDLAHAPKSFFEDLVFIKEFVKLDMDSWSYSILPERLRGNVEIASAAFLSDKSPLNNMSSRAVIKFAESRPIPAPLDGDKSFALKLVKYCPLMLSALSPELRDDDEVVLAAVAVDGYAMMCASDRLQRSKEVLLVGFQTRTGPHWKCKKEIDSYWEKTIAYDEELKRLSRKIDSKQKALDEVSPDYCGFAIQDLEPKFQKDHEVILAALRSGYYNASSLINEEKWDEKGFVIDVLHTFPSNLESVSERLRDDKNIALAALSGPNFEDFDDAENYSFLSSRLRDDVDVLRAALSHQERSLEEDKNYGNSPMCYASERLRNNREIALEAVYIDGLALEYLSDTLRADELVVRLATKQNSSAARFSLLERRGNVE